MQVTKRLDNLKILIFQKLHKVVQYACDGITGVSASEVEITEAIHSL